MPTETDTYELIEHSRAVATVTGTPAWEAILRGKPAVMLGYYWYRDCPLVFKADDVAGCRQAFEKIVKGFRIETREVINFLKSFDEATIRCYVDDPRKSIASDLSAEQQLNNLAQAIILELNAQ